MKKFRILAIISALLVLCLALVACGNKDNTPDNNDEQKKENITLTVWGSQEDQ